MSKLKTIYPFAKLEPTQSFFCEGMTKEQATNLLHNAERFLPGRMFVWAMRTAADEGVPGVRFWRTDKGQAA